MLLKRVLNTRLWPASPPVLRQADDGIADKADCWCPLRDGRGSAVSMALIREFLASLAPRLAEADPLPPDDRVLRVSTLALEDLYRSEAPKLLRFFNRRADHQDSHDLMQESFTRLADAHARHDRIIERPEAFLNRIASNVMKNEAKSAYERARANSLPVEDAGLTAPDLVAALEARDLINRVQTALMRLSPKTRDIFLAHRVDGLSYGDIGQRMGLSKKGVEWHMTKAIAHLDRTLRSR